VSDVKEVKTMTVWWRLAGAVARWRWVVAVAVVALGAVVALVFVRPAPITGVAVANQAAVVAAQADRAAAAAQQAELEAQAALAWLEDQTLQSMQGYFADPANDLSDEGLAVLSVGLIKTGDNTYEGMATMTRMGGPQRHIPIHVLADERSLGWNTDPGALLPLFN
jgi:hypothetical protein